MATEYLAKFAKLMRMVLRNSQEELILLSDEIEVAKMYLELEKIRFNDKFDFSFSLDKTLHGQEIYIPPLLMQPYLENAVWHGILHNTIKGKLDINIHKEGETLSIEIVDNGVGRKASEALKKKQSKKKSYGMNITKSRLQLVNIVHNISASTYTVDLYDEDNQPIGTKIIINIPIIKQNTYASHNNR